MTVFGTVETIATLNTLQYKKGAQDVDKANKDMEGSSDKSSKGMSSAFGTVAKVGLAAIATAAVAAGAMIVSSFGAAVKRVDTLNNSARTFENMGFSADKVNASMKALEQSIKGMPTPLDEAVRGMQMISASTNDIGKSQKIFTAMNNAIIGFGGSSADVTNAVLQMSQAFAGGRIDAQTWNSMLNSNLGPALNAIARQMGITTKKLKEGLSEGTISVETFQQALIDMNEKGGGGMKSFQQIAKDATSGIGTGWANLQTAVTRGVAEIIKAIGSEKISKALGDIGNSFEGALKRVAQFMTTVLNNEAAITALATIIGTVLVAAFAALGVAIWTALAPVLPFAAAIAALAAVAYLIKDNWPKIKPAIEPVINIFKQFWDVIKPFRDFIGEQLKNAWEDLVAAFNEAKKALEPFMPQIKKLGAVIAVVLLAPLALLVGTIIAVVAVIAVLGVAIARVVGWFAKAISAVIEFGVGVWQAINGAYQTVVKFGQDVWNAIVNTFNAVVNWLREWGATLLAIMYWPIAILVGLWYKFKDDIIAALRQAWEGIVAVFSPIVDWFKERFTNAWNNIQAIWGVVSGWFQERWNDIAAVFEVVGEFFKQRFENAVNNIKWVFGQLYDFFRGVWDRIVGIFGPIGTAIGDAIGGAFKSVINTVLKQAVNIINGFIKAINAVTGTINNIPGVKIGNINQLDIPQLAQGGIVSRPTLAMIGEGRESEAVIPLSKLDKMINGDGGGKQEVNITLNLSGIMSRSRSDERAIAKNLIEAVNEELRANGQPQIGVA